MRRVAETADLFLDTFVYNAHTTATDALWSGTPVLTLSGPDFAARVATSHVKQLGLESLTTFSLREFEDLAVRLATSPALLKGLRRRLCDTIWSSALFDTTLTTQRLEQAYEALWDLYTYDRGRKDAGIAEGTRHIIVAAGSTPRSRRVRIEEMMIEVRKNVRSGIKLNETQGVLMRLRETLGVF